MTFYGYDGATWRLGDALWAYDGATWRDIQEAWVYDGTTWRKFYEAVSCLTASYSSGTSVWTESGCTDANECQYCIGFNPINCTDPCHNIDGRMSVNGGSYVLQFTCRDKACGNQTGTDCSRNFDCNLAQGGTKCLSTSNTNQGRLEIQRDSGGAIDATYTGVSRTGSCVAL